MYLLIVFTKIGLASVGPPTTLLIFVLWTIFVFTVGSHVPLVYHGVLWYIPVMYIIHIMLLQVILTLEGLATQPKIPVLPADFMFTPVKLGFSNIMLRPLMSFQFIISAERIRRIIVHTPFTACYTAEIGWTRLRRLDGSCPWLLKHLWLHCLL